MSFAYRLNHFFTLIDHFVSENLHSNCSFLEHFLPTKKILEKKYSHNENIFKRSYKKILKNFYQNIGKIYRHHKKRANHFNSKLHKITHIEKHEKHDNPNHHHKKKIRPFSNLKFNKRSSHHNNKNLHNRHQTKATKTHSLNNTEALHSEYSNHVFTLHSSNFERHGKEHFRSKRSTYPLTSQHYAETIYWYILVEKLPNANPAKMQAYFLGHEKKAGFMKKKVLSKINHLENLEPFTSYKVRVVSVGEKCESVPSYPPISFTTAEEG